MRKQLLLYVLLALSITACIKEYGYQEPEPPELFRCSDERLKPIAKALWAIEQETPFMGKFCEVYGKPLWDYADVLEEDNQVCYFVPLLHECCDRSIETIWFFYLENGVLRYAPISRDTEGMAGTDQVGIFDLKSYDVFGADNASGLIFKDPPAETRVWADHYYDCKAAYAGYDGAEAFKGITCKYKRIWVELTLAERHYEEIGGGSGSINMRGGTGTGYEGGGSSNGFSAFTVAPKASSIFRNSRMTETNWRTLEKMIEKIEKDCVGSNLYNGLKQALGGKTLSIQFVAPKEGSSFNFDGNTAGIKLTTDMESNQLFHEMMHAFQSYQETESSYKASLINKEIEARYAQYQYVKKLKEFPGSKWEKQYTKTDVGMAIADLAESIDKKGNLQPGETDETLFIRVHTAKNTIQKIKDYSKVSFNENKAGSETFKNLRTLSKGC